MPSANYSSRGNKATLTADIDKSSMDEGLKNAAKSLVESYAGDGDARIHLTSFVDHNGAKLSAHIRPVKEEKVVEAVVERRGIQPSKEVPVAAVLPKA